MGETLDPPPTPYTPTPHSTAIQQIFVETSKLRKMRSVIRQSFEQCYIRLDISECSEAENKLYKHNLSVNQLSLVIFSLNSSLCLCLFLSVSLWLSVSVSLSLSLCLTLSMSLEGGGGGGGTRNDENRAQHDQRGLQIFAKYHCQRSFHGSGIVKVSLDVPCLQELFGFQ